MAGEPGTSVVCAWAVPDSAGTLELFADDYAFAVAADEPAATAQGRWGHLPLGSPIGRRGQLRLFVCDTRSLQVSKDSHVKEVSIG